MQSSIQTSTSLLQQPEIPATESASSMENKEQGYRIGITPLSNKERRLWISTTLKRSGPLCYILSTLVARELIDNSDIQDISLADLIPISREAISLGILNRPRYKVTTS